MSIDRVGASAAREELLAMIRTTRQSAAPAAIARRPQPEALTSTMQRPDDRMPVRHISIYV